MNQTLGNWSDSPCFYVTIRDAGRTGFVAGPFREHAAAIAAMPIAREFGYKADAWSHFYSWGTAKVQTGHREGTLNAKMRAIDPAIDRGEWAHTAEDIAEAERQEAEVAEVFATL